MSINTKPTVSGFTIVELLVVIVVVGILAAIAIVAYTGVSQKAVVASLMSDLSNASKVLVVFQAEKGNYPTTLDCGIADSDTNKCLKFSGSNSYSYYQANNTANPRSFTLMATNDTIKYQIIGNSIPTEITPITAAGGTITNDGPYRVHTFTSNGSFTVTSSGPVEVLVVGGGGSGGPSKVSCGGGGGGGAGGLIYLSNYTVTSQSYTVTIGSGGVSTSTFTDPGNNGGNSVFGPLTAIGGGGGGTGGCLTGLASSGGSGGGSGYKSYTFSAGAPGTDGQGFKGGDTLSNNNGGGGGGATGVGGNTLSGGPSGTGGSGGPGYASIISGAPLTYAKGGEGGSPPSGFANGSNNSGNGGSGIYGSVAASGAGGSGIVVVRYLAP